MLQKSCNGNAASKSKSCQSKKKKKSQYKIITKRLALHMPTLPVQSSCQSTLGTNWTHRHAEISGVGGQFPASFQCFQLALVPESLRTRCWDSYALWESPHQDPARVVAEVASRHVPPSLEASRECLHKVGTWESSSRETGAMGNLDPKAAGRKWEWSRNVEHLPSRWANQRNTTVSEMFLS